MQQTAPADDELVQQLSVLLEEISDNSGEMQAHQVAFRTGAENRKAPLFTGLRKQPNLEWLRRNVINGWDTADEASEDAPKWKSWFHRSTPLIALIALLALFAAFRYVLTPVAQKPQPVPATSQQGSDPASVLGVQKVEPARASVAAPVSSGPVRVKTIQIVPQQRARIDSRPAAPPPVVRAPAAPALVESKRVPAAAVEPAPATTASPVQQRVAGLPSANATRLVPSPPDAAEAALLERGKRMMANGDVAGARLAYGYLAERGSAYGALALAESYDPALLAKISVVGMSGDREKAISLYRRAAELGSLEAARRLARMQVR